MALTRDEARLLAHLVSRAMEVSQLKTMSASWGVIHGKLSEMAQRAEMGDLVFRLTLPLREVERRPGGKEHFVEIAPTMNVYYNMEAWALAKSRARVDLYIMGARPSWPAWPARGRRRGVVVSRHSSARPDEVSVDALGGKIPLDRLVRGEVLAGDSPKHLVREAVWVKAKPGEGKLVVDVHELVDRTVNP